MKNKTLLGLNLSVFLMMLGVGMIVAILPQRIIQLTGSSEPVNYLASAFGISYVILQIPIGYFSDRFGFKFFLVLGYAVCFLTGLLYYFSNNTILYFLGRFVQGAGEAPIWALAPALLSIKYPELKGKVMGIYNASIHIGLTIGPLLGIFLSSQFSGNQPFTFYAIVCLLGAFIVYFCVDNVNTGMTNQTNSFDIKNIIKLLSSKDSLITLIGITIYGAGYGLFLTTIPAFLINEENFNPTLVGIYFVLFYVSISLSQIITGVLSDKMGRKFFMILGLLIASVGLVSFSELNRPLTISMLTIGSLGLGVFYLSSMAFLNEIVPNSLKGTISGAYYLFWGLGYFFGPILVGKFGESVNYSLGYQLFSIILLLQAIFMMFLISRNKFNVNSTFTPEKQE